MLIRVKSIVFIAIMVSACAALETLDEGGHMDAGHDNPVKAEIPASPNEPGLNAIPPEYREEVAALNKTIDSFHQHAIPVFNAKHSATHTRLGIIYFDIGNMKEARYNLERAINMGAEPAEAHLYLGRVLNHVGEYKKAINEYRLTLQMDPKQIEAHQLIASSYQALGMEEEAQAEIQAYESASH